MRGLIARLLADRSGVAATEFALVIPVLIVVFMGLVEVSNFVMQNRRAYQAATLAAEFLSRDGDNVLRAAERHIVEDIWMIVNPTAHLATTPRGGVWANGYSRAMASVAFATDPACRAATCPLLPEVDWSFLYQDVISTPVYTHCDLDIVENSDPLDGHSIREGMVGRAPVVVVDFTYPYIPLLQGWFFPTSELHVNAVRKTRNGVLLGHETDSLVQRC